MSTLLLATADVPWLLSNDWVASTGAARTGSKSFYNVLASSTKPLIFYFNSGNNELYFRFCINWAGSHRILTTRLATSTAAIISVVTTSLGHMELRQGTSTGTLLHTVYDIVQQNIWVTSEVHLTTTSCTWKINGIQVYTNNSISFTLNDITLWATSGTSGSSTFSWRGYIDDIVVCTDKWPGQGGLHVFEPTGAGTTTDWSSALPTLSTPGDTADVRHQFTVADAPATAAIVHRLGVAVSAKVDGQGYGALIPGLNTDFTADPAALSISPRITQRYWPGVSLVDFNNLEIGVQSA